MPISLCLTFETYYPILSENRTTMDTIINQSSRIPAADLGQLGGLLNADLNAWWEHECGDWDMLVEGKSPENLPGGEDLWNCMPVVDSKAVARTSPIFERYFGIPLDVKLIRRGGYKSIDEMIGDLVPKMLEIVKSKRAGANSNRN